jgi:hypothetical protein
LWGAMFDKIGFRELMLHHQNAFPGEPVNGEDIVPKRIRRMDGRHLFHRGQRRRKDVGWISFQDDGKMVLLER